MKSLFVAWRPAPPDLSGWRPVGRLEFDEGLYRFFYTQGARKPGFHPFPQMSDLDQVYESEMLFPLFANRLLSKSRPEYEDYLRWSGFDTKNPPDPIVVLGITEGIRQTDAVEVFPCPMPSEDGCYTTKFFLHGIRWLDAGAIERIGRLQVGEPLKLMLDLQNEYDSLAVAVRTQEESAHIGYVPRYLANDVGHIFRDCDPQIVDLRVDQVNLDAPLQNRVLCQMRACWPTGFQPCSGEDFQPIPRNVTSSC